MKSKKLWDCFLGQRHAWTSGWFKISDHIYAEILDSRILTNVNQFENYVRENENEIYKVCKPKYVFSDYW